MIKTLVIIDHTLDKLSNIKQSIDATQQFNIAAGEQLKIIHVVTQDLMVNWQVKVNESGAYEHWLINLSQHSVNYKLDIALDGRAAAAKIRSIIIGKNKAALKHQLRIDHNNDQTTTDILAHSIADEQAKVAFEGIIHVKAGTKNVEAHELLKSLLLTNKAEIAVKPILEIYSDEVACTHGASIGNLDEDALFYLESRGFSALEAKAVLLKSFVTQFLPELDEELRQWLEGLILHEINMNKETP